jgi:hypothetical protein
MRLHSELRALFVQLFIHDNERFRTAFPWVQRLRAWWVGLTLPPRFLVARATPSGWEYTAFDFVECRAAPVDARQAHHALAEAVSRFPWLGLLAGALCIVWLAWLPGGSSPAAVVFKTLLLGCLGLAGWAAHCKWARAYIAYELDRESRLHLEAVRSAVGVLRHSSRLWLFEAQTSAGRLQTVKVRGSVRNLQTNLRLGGLTCRGEAVYFLPDQVLVGAGGLVHFVAYDRCAVAAAHLEYTEREGHVWADAVQVGRAWKKVRADGSPDVSDPNNVELPVLRLGRLSLDMGGTRVELLTTNPEVPEQFHRCFFSGPGLLAAEQWPGPAPPFGNPGGKLVRLITGAVTVLGRLPAKAWVALVAVAILLVGAGFAWHFAPATEKWYRSLKADREVRQAEAAVQKREADEKARRQREEEEDFQRRAKDEWERQQQEMRERDAKEEARRREEQRKKQAEEEARRIEAEEAQRRQQAIAKAEAKAAPNFHYAQGLIDKGELEKGIQRLKEIVREYPEAPSAAKARELLRELGVKEP